MKKLGIIIAAGLTYILLRKWKTPKILEDFFPATAGSILPLWSGSYCYTVIVRGHGFRGPEGEEWYTVENPDGSWIDWLARILQHQVGIALEQGCGLR